MTRCDFDGVFHRVFCVTLLAIAFTFTVILTNVFIDIDGLLSTKGNAKIDRIQTVPKTSVVINRDETKIERIQVVPETSVVVNRDERMNRFEPELFADDFNRYEEDTEEPPYRTKRSLDSSNFRFHIKNPKMKKVLTNRLATLLEELDAEESHPNKIDRDTVKEDKLTREAARKEDRRSDKERDLKKDAKMLHLAMHNILLQGIIGHMDLGEAYRKVNTAVKKVNQDIIDESKNEKYQQKQKSEENSKELTTKPSTYNVESKFFEELANCNELHQQIKEKTGQKNEIEPKRSNKKKGGKMLIKTVIDITSLGSEKNKENNTNSNENIKGIIKLIYNGKSIKFIPMEDEKKDKIDEVENVHKKQEETHKNKNLEAPELLNENVDSSNIPKEIINDALTEYFKKYQNPANRFEGRNKFSGRPKRNVKVRGKADKLKTGKKDDEELYVEIETHFDSKGIKGKKKKELIRSLVDKIQKAIHEDIDSLKDPRKKKKHGHIKKRIQHPLDKAHTLLQNKITLPFKAMEHRESHPLSKAVPAEENVPYMFDKTGEAWQKKYSGPNYLTSAKAINSGEMGEVNLEYNKVVKSTGIPQRLQQPLNTEPDALDTMFDLGNLNFVIKELDGSGFSIGFNQYVGEAPDPESVKFFTGLHELVKDYDDKVETAPDVNEYDQERTEYAETSHELKKRQVVRNKRHTNRKSPSAKDHSNEYKIIFNNNFMPYDSYQEIFEDRSKKVAISLQKHETRNQSYHHNPNNIKLRNKNQVIEDEPVIIDEDFLSRDMRPSEIFGLANLLNRKKRAIKVKQISKIKTKNNVKRYIPTKSKKIYIKKKKLKRNKRQVDKIRIIARDHSPRHSTEDIFVISDENDFAERAVIRHEPENNNRDEENSEYESHYAYDRADYASTIFNGRSRHNALMSKYPHVFLEEISKPKDETIEYPFYNQHDDRESDTKRETIENKLNFRKNEALDEPNSNYKVTLKISPKNESTRGGFKEVHTSINKSISKNGLLYSSLVNVSEFSRIENDSKTEKPCTIFPKAPSANHIKEQPEKMTNFLRQQRFKIDEQLAHLQKEKQHLDLLITDKNVPKSSELIDFVLPLNPPKLLHLTKKEAGELLSSAFMKLQRTPELNYVASTIPTTQSTTVSTACTTPKPTVCTTTPKPTVCSTTPKPTTCTTPKPTACTTPKPTTIKPATLDPEKEQIVTTVLRSENLTNKILNKIDRNTALLQTFLQKLSERVESTTRRELRQEKQAKTDHHRDYREYIHNPFLIDTMPNMEYTKNDTHVSIPFVYAYQQPYPLHNKLNTPMASVIYQGHIHTNTLHRNNNQNIKECDDFKVKQNIPINHQINPRDINLSNIKMNMPQINHRENNMPYRENIVMPQINQREINMPQINERELNMPQMNQRDINMPQMNQRDINMPQMNQRDIKMSQMKQRDMNLPQMIQRDINMPQINQRDIKMPQMNQRDMNLPQMIQRDINMPQINQRDIKMPQLNQRDMNLPQMNKRDINMPQMKKRDIIMPQINQRDLNMSQVNQGVINIPQRENTMPHRDNIVMLQNNQIENIVEASNQTKFFIDTSGTGYTLMPSDTMKQFMNSKPNSTNGLI